MSPDFTKNVQLRARRYSAPLLVVAATGFSASRAEAGCTTPAMVCGSSAYPDQNTVHVTGGGWPKACVPGFILTTIDGSTQSIDMTLTSNSLSISQKFTSPGCCGASYVEVGGFDGCQVSDQWALPGSHLPLKISELEQLKGAWTFKVPMPLGTDYTKEQYRVYFEMFLSKTADGQWGGGNITVVFFWNLYSFNTPTGHAVNLNGPQGMDVIDYKNTDSKGPFVDFLFPKGTYAPDTSGTITVSAVDVKAVLDYAVKTFPQYYTGDLYLSTLSLAEETGAFTGNVDTSYASFAIKKTGSDVVYTPPFTSSHWASTGGAGSTSTGGASATTGGSGAVSTSTGGTKTTGSASGGAVATSTGGTKATTSTSGGAVSTATGGSKTAGSTSGGAVSTATGGSKTAGSASGGAVAASTGGNKSTGSTAGGAVTAAGGTQATNPTSGGAGSASGGAPVSGSNIGGVASTSTGGVKASGAAGNTSGASVAPQEQGSSDSGGCSISSGAQRRGPWSLAGYLMTAMGLIAIRRRRAQ